VNTRRGGIAVSQKLGLPLNQDDVLKIVRRGKKLGMTYSEFAETLEIPVNRLRAFVLRYGTFEDVNEIMHELRRVPPLATSGREISEANTLASS